MIILNQKKDEFINVENTISVGIMNCDEDGFSIFATCVVGVDDIYKELGFYRTKKRAKEVLLDIINLTCIKEVRDASYEYADIAIKLKKYSYYEMPSK